MMHMNRTNTTVALALCLLAFVSTMPFSLADTIKTVPVGVIVTSGKVMIGEGSAPSGTTLFSGDKVLAEKDGALINFFSGSRIEMTKATAIFTQQGKTLVANISQGLLRFNFAKGEDVQIHAGKFNFVVKGNSAHVGELGFNNKGEIAVTMSEGALSLVDSNGKAIAEVDSNHPFADVIASGMSTTKTAALIGGAGAVVGASVGLKIIAKPPTPKSVANK
jgi:hypothetical protein